MKKNINKKVSINRWKRFSPLQQAMIERNNPCFTITIKPNVQGAGVIFRHFDATNYWVFFPTNTLLRIQEIVGGVAQTRTSVPYVNAAYPQTYRVGLLGSSIACSIDEIVGAVTTFTSASLQLVTKHGVRLGTSLDDFRITVP